ncbi:glycosyltransferase [Sphingomonas canadensis]|uniref:Glycosyltransferase n=1 Tax=Sphingomonas canadensis TaxID=1219257 RepID=A0ABW3H7T1_9SPHN|nr:glycosyltransferase [Sphingomonas canadensis]MCW3837196.1 glycosyltransferase [Sphingomonas canadensis]
MRVVDVNELYSPTGGGVRTYIDRKFGIMADLGHELVVIAPGKRDEVEERPGGGRIHWVRSPLLPLDTNYRQFSRVRTIRSLLDAIDPDVVEVCAPWAGALAVRNWHGRALKVYFAHNDNLAAYPRRWLHPLVSAERVERVFHFYTRWMHNMLAPFDAFVTNGPTLARDFTRRGFDAVPMPLGIEEGYFSPDHRDERLREALLAQCGLPRDGLLLLGLGRHHSEKRWPMVIDAIDAAGADIPVGMVMLGDGPARASVEARIKGSPHIRLFRPVYDRHRLASIIASCDALVHGSSDEPFGLVAHEALASGLPLIVPDRGGCAEIADPLFAETYRAGDARACADAIRRLHARERTILRAAARHAAARVRTGHDHARELMAHYAALLERRRALAA